MEIKVFLYLHVLQERGVLGAIFLPHPFPSYLWENFSRARAKSRRRGGYVTSELLLENWQSPASGPARRTRKKGGWVRGREGGERRGRQGNRGLYLDTNLNRYCPSRSAGLMRQQAANSGAVPKLGDTTCIFPLPFFPLSVFSVTLPYFFFPPLSHFSCISLHCLQMLPWYLWLDLSLVYASLTKVSSKLFISEENLLPLTAPSLLSSFGLLGNFSQQWTAFRMVGEAEEEQRTGDQCNWAEFKASECWCLAGTLRVAIMSAALLCCWVIPQKRSGVQCEGTCTNVGTSRGTPCKVSLASCKAELAHSTLNLCLTLPGQKVQDVLLSLHREE